MNEQEHDMQTGEEHDGAEVAELGSRRRGYGLGAITQRTERGPDVWTVTVNYRRDPVTGKRRRFSRTIHGTRQEAEALLADMLSGRPIREANEQEQGLTALAALTWCREHGARVRFGPMVRVWVQERWAKGGDLIEAVTALRQRLLVVGPGMSRASRRPAPRKTRPPLLRRLWGRLRGSP